MADSKLTARREARKRRILENSDDRLQKIFGNLDVVKGPHSKEEDCSSRTLLPKLNGDAVNNSLPEVSRSTREKSVSFSEIEGHSDSTHSEPQTSDNDFHVNSELLTSIVREFLEDKPIGLEDESITPAVHASKTTKVISHKVRKCRIIFLAIIVNLALNYNYGFLFGEVLIVPFVLLEIAESLLGTKNEPTSASSGILGMVLLLSGINPQRVSKIASISFKLSNLLQNFSIYLFFFIITNIIVKWPL